MKLQVDGAARGGMGVRLPSRAPCLTSELTPSPAHFPGQKGMLSPTRG